MLENQSMRVNTVAAAVTVGVLVVSFWIILAFLVGLEIGDRAVRVEAIDVGAATRDYNERTGETTFRWLVGAAEKEDTK